MMHKSPAIRIIGMISWFLTALAALFIGLMKVNIDVIGTLIGWGVPVEFFMALDWALLVAGIVSMGLFFMALMHQCGCKDGHCNCKN